VQDRRSGEANSPLDIPQITSHEVTDISVTEVVLHRFLKELSRTRGQIPGHHALISQFAIRFPCTGEVLEY